MPIATAPNMFLPHSRIRDGEELHKAILSLAGGTIHDNMNRRAKIGGDEFRMGAEELSDRNL